MKPRRKRTWKICNDKKSRDKNHKGEEAWSLYLTQISQTLKSSNSDEAQTTWNIIKLRKLIRKLKAQESQVVGLGWRETERPKNLHKRNKGTQSDSSIKMDVVATHAMSERPQTLATFNFRVLQTFDHPCPFDLNPYAWIDVHYYRNQLQTFV